MRTMLAFTALIALGTMAVHGAVVGILLAFAVGGGFLIGATTRHVWRGGES